MSKRTLMILSVSALAVLSFAAMAHAYGGGWHRGGRMMEGYGGGYGHMMQGYGGGYGHMMDGNGQRGFGPGWAANLTDEQRADFLTLRAEHLKKSAPLRAEMQVKRAERNALLASGQIDSAKVETLSKEIAVLELDLIKERDAFRKSMQEKFGEVFASRGAVRGAGRGGYGPGYGYGPCFTDGSDND